MHNFYFFAKIILYQMIILPYLLYERCINKKGSENDSEPFYQMLFQASLFQTLRLFQKPLTPILLQKSGL